MYYINASCLYFQIEEFENNVVNLLGMPLILLYHSFLNNIFATGSKYSIANGFK